MIKFFAFMLLLGNLVAAVDGQAGKTCSRVVVQDKDRHGFDELTTIKLDVDRDGKLDSLIPKTRVTKGRRGIKHWISFEVKLAGRPQSRQFFKYMYGDQDPYWVWALVPCRINSDKYPDLLFYSGDDTSQESVYLLNTKNSFRVYKRPGKRSLG